MNVSSGIIVILESLKSLSLSCFVRRHDLLICFSNFKSAVFVIKLFLLASFLALKKNLPFTCFSVVLFIVYCIVHTSG